MGLCRGQGCFSGEFQGSYTNRTLYTQGRCVILSQPQEKRAHACMGTHMWGYGGWGVGTRGRKGERIYPQYGVCACTYTWMWRSENTLVSLLRNCPPYFWVKSLTVPELTKKVRLAGKQAPRVQYFPSSYYGDYRCGPPCPGVVHQCLGVGHRAQVTPQVWVTMPRCGPPCPGVGHRAQLFSLGSGAHFTNQAISEEGLWESLFLHLNLLKLVFYHFHSEVSKQLTSLNLECPKGLF